MTPENACALPQRRKGSGPLKLLAHRDRSASGSAALFPSILPCGLTKLLAHTKSLIPHAENPWTPVFCTKAWSSSSKGVGEYFETSVLYTGLSYTFSPTAFTSVLLSCGDKVGQECGAHLGKGSWYTISSQTHFCCLTAGYLTLPPRVVGIFRYGCA